MNRIGCSIVLSMTLGSSLGCNFEVPDEISGLTSRFVAQGMYLGIEAPEDENIASALEESDFGGGAQLTVFFADAANVDEIEEAPIAGLRPVFRSDSAGSSDLVEGAEGQYTLNESADIAYVGGENIVISVEYADESRKLNALTPQGPSFSLAEIHTAGAPMAVNLQGQGFDTTLVTVIDVVTGEVTYDNLPTDISEVLDLGGEEDESSSSIEIPGVAFATESIYAVGVGGLVKSDTANFVEVNTLLSGLKSGTMAFQPVCTFSEALLCDQ